MRKKIITVFGSAFSKPGEPYYSEIEQIGGNLVSAGYDVCSGGYAGIMEAISKGAKAAGGNTIGITVDNWTNSPNQYVDDVVSMPNLMERIMELITIADGYVVLKGGTGTLVELSVTLELMNKKAMPEKPIIFYGDFWRDLIEILKLDSDKLQQLITRNVKFAGDADEITNYLQ